MGLYNKSAEGGTTLMSKKPMKQVAKIEEEEAPNKMYSFLIGGVIVIAIMILFAIMFH